ncbi:MAG TPA: anthranilate synthase component I [Desulfobulbaceae bacterium]|nr:anthranilate synthase component I [Desulfobulbaceae bacterium]
MSDQPFFPDIAHFHELAVRHRLVPVAMEITADLDTPLTLFMKMSVGYGDKFLFESMEGGEKWGRWSFIGCDPLLSFTSRGKRITIREDGNKKVRRFTGQPLPALRRLLAKLAAAEVPGLPRFCGGLIGYLGYDLVRSLEDLPNKRPLLPYPDTAFMVPRLLVAHDSLRQKATLICWTRLSGSDDVDAVYADAIERLRALIVRLRGALRVHYRNHAENRLLITESIAEPEFTANMTPGSFAAMVERAKEYILAGDVIQVVLSQRFQTEAKLLPVRLYRALRQVNPSPYLFYLQLGKVTQIGSSPEILVRLTGGEIELRPIAGTRRRGKDEEEDLALEKELLADPKERAEHVMLVDLGRNDVGRIAEGGSVSVRDLMVVERYSHVMHLVSGVCGKLAAGKDQFDVVAACFPAGTVSGAPKIRAMEIINELEPERRGPYAGAVGYFGFGGAMDFCITIRTIIAYAGKLSIQAGAGIVADSDPEREYQETINKSMALRRAVELAYKGF